MPIVTVKNCLNCGIDHEWLFRSFTLQELRTIKQLTGLTQNGFNEASDDGDPDALAAMLFVLHERDHIKIPFEDIDLDMHDLDTRLTEEEQAKLAARKAAEARDE